MTQDLVTDYLRLGLRFDRIVGGYVDAYTGPEEHRKEVANEPAPQPADLAKQARELLQRLPDTDLDPARAEFLRAHLAALDAGGRRLAGEAMSFAGEVEAYFDVRIEPLDTDEFAAAHDAIDALLPGPGSLDERWSEFRDRDKCRTSEVEAGVKALATALRKIIEPVGLPDAEHIEFEIAADAAWSGFNYYLGRFRSRVAVNAGVGHRASQLPVLTAHECYPGHHTEHCRKELLLIDGNGWLEHSIFLVNTPQCVMAEGLGDLALSAAIGPGWGSWAAGILDGITPRFDPELAEALELAGRPLNAVRQNAALLLHDAKAGPDEVIAYLRRWGLVTEERARQSLRFLSDPLWRAYISTYVEGERLLRPWLDARPADQSALDRFQRLLDEPMTPAVIRTELAAAAPAAR